VAEDYFDAVFLWDGQVVAYLYEQEHVYGLSGRHLGWFIGDVLYDQEGARVGFTSATCPVPIGKRGPKNKRSVLPELKPRWAAPPLPKLTFRESGQALADFLNEGRLLHER
jgi:hypothetical protein